MVSIFRACYQPVHAAEAITFAGPQVNERLDYRVLHAELMGQMDMAQDRAAVLEVELVKTEEQRDQLQVRKVNICTIMM